MYREVSVENVERGAALLDRHYAGWEDRIDPDRLDLGSSSDCVLGQLYGHYGGGLVKVFGNMERVGVKVEHGFTLGAAPASGHYVPLTAAWRRLIEARRGAGHGS
jgi:hypothetical protein